MISRTATTRIATTRPDDPFRLNLKLNPDRLPDSGSMNLLWRGFWLEQGRTAAAGEVERVGGWPVLSRSEGPETLRECDLFVRTLETVRRWYGFWLLGYVVMPEHVHLLLSEPERANLALVLQMLKQMFSLNLRRASARSPFWQARYYDFNVWSEPKRVEKLRDSP